VGLLGNEPEEGGVEKIEAVNGAEDLQREIEPSLQLSLTPPSPKRPWSCRYLITLLKIATQNLPIAAYI